MIQDLNISREEITFGLDSVVVRKFTDGVFGGLILDTTGYPLPDVIAGQAVITDGEVYRPMPIRGEAYGDMPEGFRFFGLVYRSSRIAMGVSVMTRGSINKYRAPYNLLSVRERFERDCPYIIFASDADEMNEYARLEASDGVVYTSEGREIWFRTKESGENTEGV